jgi:tyrosyl-tRNA synthetase
MEAKQRLARLVVERYHGADAASKASDGFQHKFQERGFPSEPDVRLALTKGDLRADGTISLTDLVAKTGLVPSKSEARRLIIQGGLELNGEKQTDANGVLTPASGQSYQMKVGRKKFALVELKD